MFKIWFQSTIALITSIIVIFSIASPASAQISAGLPLCSSSTATTNPPEILDNTPQATFTIDIGQNNIAGISKWQMQFQCSNINLGFATLPYQEAQATANGDGKTIAATINNDFRINLLGVGCEFNSINNPIKIKVVAVKSDNSKVDFCQSSYTAKKYIPPCTLSIQPDKDIIFPTPLNVSGEIKNKDPLVLFFDDVAIDIQDNDLGRIQLEFPGTGVVATPNFGPISIPQGLLTPGPHSVSLRQRNWGVRFLQTYPGAGAAGLILSNSKTPLKDFFGSPLCPVIFNIGTPTNPGSISALPINTVKGCSLDDIEKGNCSLSGGKILKGCTDNAKNPGISTAIGCIHTNPIEFVKDLLTFIIAISGGLAFLMMLLGAFQMLTSAGNPESLNAGKERLTSAIIGLLFVIFAILLMQIIGVGFLALPDFR